MQVKNADEGPREVAVADPGFVWDDDVTPKLQPRDDDDSGIEDNTKSAVSLFWSNFK